MSGDEQVRAADLPILYNRALVATEQYVNGIQADQWDNPTPNSEWNVHQVLNHLVNENWWANELLRGRTMEEVGDQFDGDLLGDDPYNAWLRSSEAAGTAAQIPGTMDEICHLSFGDYPCSEYVSQLFLEVVIHGWDIATSTGQDTTLDPELVSSAYPIAQRLAEFYRSTGVIGEAVSVPESADTQTHLLALFGRRMT